MAATITTSTRFTQVSLGATFSGMTFALGSLYAVTDEETPKIISLSVNKDGDLAGNADDLAILRQIWASTDGFMDSDDNPITPTMLDNYFGVTVTLDDYHSRSLPHILDPTSDARWANMQRVDGDQGRLSTRSANSDGIITHVEQLGRVPGLTSADGTTQTYLFNEWIASYGGGTNNPPPLLTYEYVREDGVTSANATNQPEYKAIWRLLQSIKASGDDVPANGPDLSADDFDAANPLPGRTFTFTPEGGTAQIFTLGTISFTSIESDLFPGENFISAFSVVINVTTGTYNTDTYTRWLQAQTTTIGVIANSMRPLSGSLQVPHSAREILLPNGLRLIVIDGVVYHDQPDGSRMPIIGNTGKEWFHSQLPDRTGGGKTILPDPEVIVITVIGATAANLYFPTPNSLVSPGQSRELVIQNVSTATTTIYDSGGTRRLTLPAGQWAEWRINRQVAGNARITLSQVSDRRRHTMIGGMVGNLANGDYLNFDSGHWFRPMYTPAMAAYNDADGFTAGPTTYGYTAGAAFSSVTDWFVRGSLRPEASGELIFYQSVELKVEDGVSGTLPSGSEARLYRQPSGTGTPQLLGTPNTYQEISGSRDVQTMTWLYVGPILATDVLFAGLRYNKTGGLNPGDVDIVSFTRIALLRPDIVLT